jgi:hypothetical protein
LLQTFSRTFQIYGEDPGRNKSKQSMPAAWAVCGTPFLKPFIASHGSLSNNCW